MPVVKKYSQLKEARINLREAIPLTKPFTILFEPTSICNFTCECCFHSYPDFHAVLPKGSMKFADFQKIVDDLAAWDGDKIKVIRIIGFGEPLVNPLTPLMVKYLKELQVAERIEITTNASLLKPDISRQLIDYGLDYLRCSIYSMTREKHRQVTRNKIEPEAIKQNITGLRSIRDSLGADKPFIYVKMLESDDELENERFLSAYSGIADEVALEKGHHWLDNTQDQSLRTRMVCPQPFKMLSIHYNGDVILCDPDWRGNTKVGNALSENISAIWGGEKMRRFWKLQLENRRLENESCRHCSFLNDDYALDDLDGVDPGIILEE